MAARLQLQHLTIGDLAGDLPEDLIRFRSNPGKWSVLENIAHLAAYQPVFIDRLERITRETAPAFDRYVAENDPRFPPYVERSSPELIAAIAGDRMRILSLLDQGGDALLTRTGLHSRYGLLTVTDWTEFFLLHEAHHLYTIFQLVRDLQASHPVLRRSGQ